MTYMWCTTFAARVFHGEDRSHLLIMYWFYILYGYLQHYFTIQSWRLWRGSRREKARARTAAAGGHRRTEYRSFISTQESPIPPGTRDEIGKTESDKQTTDDCETKVVSHTHLQRPPLHAKNEVYTRRQWTTTPLCSFCDILLKYVLLLIKFCSYILITYNRLKIICGDK